MRAELESAQQDRLQLEAKVKMMEAQQPAPKTSLMQRRAISLKDFSQEAECMELKLPGAICKEKERSASDTSTAATLTDLPADLPINAWSCEEDKLKPKRRSRFMTEATGHMAARNGDVQVTIQVQRCSFKNLRFAMEAADSPVQPDTSVDAESSQQSKEPESQAAEPRLPPKRLSRRACTEAWGGRNDATPLWGRRRNLLEKADMDLRVVSEKVMTASEPISPKRARGRKKTRPSTWDVKDMESYRANSLEFGSES